MRNMNTCNYGVAIGRLVRQPKVYENRDGSHKVLYTLAVNRNFQNKEGRRDSDFVNLEAFLPAGRKVDQSVYSRLRVGELVAVRHQSAHPGCRAAGRQVPDRRPARPRQRDRRAEGRHRAAGGRQSSLLTTLTGGALTAPPRKKAAIKQKRS